MSGEWSDDLVSVAGIDRGLLPPLHDPGAGLGRLRPELGIDAELVAVGSHDTASAVVGVPAVGERFGYICCGTWGLVGVELDAPVLSAAGRKANFTNERGVDGRIRYLRNVMGLWLLQESLRTWMAAGLDPDLSTLLAEAASLVPCPVIDVGDPGFLPPGDMPAWIAAACRAAGRRVPASPAEVVRCLVDSLAEAFGAALRAAVRLSGRDVDVVHLVGGGALNDLLCQRTADACERTVLAGPVEATALGNVLVQARAAGLVGPDLGDLRRLVARTHRPRRFEPRL